jgi:hypothetical protein
MRTPAVLLVATVITAVALATPSGAAERQKAPPLTGVTLEGKRISLAQFKGRPVLINVWSSW